MNGSLTATRHTLNFNSLSFDKFEELCLWLVEDLGEYKIVEHYGGTGDKNRDVIGCTYDDELDYFQCKRYEGLAYGVLKTELDGISKHIKDGAIKRPRRIYFVLSSSVSSEVKDKLKSYVKEIDLPEPSFWEPVILDKKVKRNSGALENFFGISDKKEEHLPQVDITGLIAYGTHDTTFTAVNHSGVPAIDCSWSLMGFAWGGYPGVPTVFDLKPQETRDLRIAMPGDFMKQNQIRELRIRFKFRDNKNNWYFSERMLSVELVNSGAFYRIKAEAGEFIPARPLTIFSIDSIEPIPPTGIRTTVLITYTYNKETRHLIIELSHTLRYGIWRFNIEESNYAIKELAERKIIQMIEAKRFEEKFVVNSDFKPTQETGFDAYKELRDSIDIPFRTPV